MAKIAHHLRTLPIAVLILLTVGAFAAVEAPDLRQLRDQLKKAQGAEDKPAIIELTRRIVAIAPNDPGTWDTLAQTQLESDDLYGLERTLDQWQKAFRRPPAAIEDFRAGLCFKRKDYQVQSSTGLRLSRPNGRELTWRPITTVWRNHAQSRRVGQTTQHIGPRQSRRRTRRHGAFCVPWLFCA